MNFSEITNEQLAEKLCKADFKIDSKEAAELFIAIKYKLCPVKHIYFVRYKWSTNDHSWLYLSPTKVRAASPKEAAQTFVDANISIITGDVSFMVSTTESSAGVIFPLSELE